MKMYYCYRTGGGPQCEVVDCPDRDTAYTDGRYALPLVDRHGSGIEWGYMGTGPNKLAASILQDYYHEPYTQDSHWPLQEFKETFLANMPRHGELIMEDEIECWRETLHEELAAQGKRGFYDR
jgi:hypothetical protein